MNQLEYLDEFGNPLPQTNDPADILRNKFITPAKFCDDIEADVLENGGTYMQAIVDYCEEKDLEYSQVAKLINRPIKEKLMVEAVNLNHFKKCGTLPV